MRCPGAAEQARVVSWKVELDEAEQAQPTCADCGGKADDKCPGCGKCVCSLCAEREGSFCCDGEGGEVAVNETPKAAGMCRYCPHGLHGLHCKADDCSCEWVASLSQWGMGSKERQIRRIAMEEGHVGAGYDSPAAEQAQGEGALTLEMLDEVLRDHINDEYNRSTELAKRVEGIEDYLERIGPLAPAPPPPEAAGPGHAFKFGAHDHAINGCDVCGCPCQQPTGNVTVCGKSKSDPIHAVPPIPEGT
jgi:hypothetical protein